MRIISTSSFALVILCFFPFAAHPYSDDAPFENTLELFEWPVGDMNETKNPPAPNIGQQLPMVTPPKPSAEVQETKNNRMNALEGSHSRWSGQLNLTYSGSSISNPFSEKAPNPGNQVPPPLVTLSGAVSARYRIDAKTTAGVGTGVTTQTPFQGPKNTTFADPYMDIAHSFKIGVIQNRADFQTTLWTNNQYHDTYGYRLGFTGLNESYFTFPVGLTVGFFVQVDANLFASGDHYDSSQQTLYDIYTNPYFEFRLSNRFNLRSVIGIASLHNRNLPQFTSLYHPDIYQTLGLGISLGKTAFIYPYAVFFPLSGNLTSQATLFGFNTIINLF